jgi:hypothetical protein
VFAAPLLALSYFAIGDGKKELDAGSVSAWAEPARRIVGGLETFASPDRVYATYTQLFALLFPGLLLCAFLAFSGRPQSITRPERWGWTLALVGYSLMGVGLVTVSLLLIGASPNGNLVNIPFIALMFPGMLLALLGSTTLGVALLRAGRLPRLTSWLLTLSLPLAFVGSVVLGHNSIGIVPLFIAWAATGYRFPRNQPTSPGTPRWRKHSRTLCLKS